MCSQLRSFFLVLLMSFTCAIGYSNKRVDSLLSVVNQRQNIEIQAFDQLLLHYAKNEPDSLYNLGKQLLNRAIKEENEVAEMLAYLYLADYYSERGKHNLALDNLNRSKEYFERNYNATELVNIYNGIGNVHFRKGSFKDAVKWYLKSMSKGDELDNIWMMNMAKLNLGRSYIQLNDTLKGEATILDYIEQVRKLERSTELANAYNVLGGYYQGIGEHDLADYYFNEALVISMTNGDKRNVAHSYNNLAISYFYQSKKDLSKAYFHKALKSRIEFGNLHHISESYYNLGDWFFFENELDSASLYYKLSYDVGEQASSFSAMADALMALTEVEKARANFSLALTYYEEYVELKEKQFLSSTNEDIAVLEFDHMIAEAKRKNQFINDQQQNEIHVNQFIGRNKWFSIVSAFIVFSIVVVIIARSVSERKTYQRELKQQASSFEQELVELNNLCKHHEDRLKTLGYELSKIAPPEQRQSPVIVLGDPAIIDTRMVRVDERYNFYWSAELELAESILFWMFLDRNKAELSDGDNIDEVLCKQSIIEAHELHWFLFDGIQNSIVLKSGVSVFQGGLEKDIKHELDESYLIIRTELLRTDFHILTQFEQELIKVRSFSSEMLQNSFSDVVLARIEKKTEVCFYRA